jgi:hypothetical protein
VKVNFVDCHGLMVVLDGEEVSENDGAGGLIV